MLRNALLLPLALAASTALHAQSAPPKPDAVVKARQSAFQVLAWHTGRVKTNLDGPFDKALVLQSAETIDALAASGLFALFTADAASAKGWHDTTAKGDATATNARFVEAGTAFSKEAHELARTAAAGDPAAIKVQFSKLTRTCKACHDDFRNAN